MIQANFGLQWISYSFIPASSFEFSAIKTNAFLNRVTRKQPFLKSGLQGVT
jgi:hypothetical protein